MEHFSSSSSATSVVVTGLHGDVILRQSAADDRGGRVWARVDGVIEFAERSGVVTLRGARGRMPIGARLQVMIEVPPDCAVALRRVTGVARIGDIGSALSLELDGVVDVCVGHVKTASICLRGDGGRVAIAAVEDRALGIDVIGAGRVRAGGSVERLRARVLGSGNIAFAGDAETADLMVAGIGHINVGRVSRQLRRWCVGAGDARVSYPPHPVCDASAASEEPVGVGRVGG